jgi:hypothetical protein
MWNLNDNSLSVVDFFLTEVQNLFIGQNGLVVLFALGWFTLFF